MNAGFRDYYAVLGIDQAADLATIKKAYRQRALECHPDRGGSHEQMLLINEAYAILSNPQSRATYDEARRVPTDVIVVERATNDSHDARARAQEYPREWSQFQSWLDALTADFANAKYNHGVFPTIENSGTGYLFVGLAIVGGFVLAIYAVNNWGVSAAYAGKFFILAAVGGAVAFHKFIGKSLGVPSPSASNTASGAIQPQPSATVIVACPQCGQQLRVPHPQQDLKLRCGRCSHEFHFKTETNKAGAL